MATVEATAYDRPVAAGLAECGIKVASREDRFKELGELLAANGVRLGDTDEDVQVLDEWFRAGVAPGPVPGRMRSLWYAVVHDIGLFLGDVMIRRYPGLRWELFTAGKRDISYHKHVVTGFSRVANPRYNVDPDGLVVMYGYQLIEGGDVAGGFFVAVLTGVTDKV